MTTRTGGEAVVRTLVEAGIDTAFGIPGTHSMSIHDAILDRPGFRHILVRHEQAAAFMADGYARASGGIGVCLTTTGPAVLNASAGLATAYGDSCPVLLLCSQIPGPYIGRDKGVFHEIPDQLGVLKRLTGFSARGSSVQDAVHQVQTALQRMRSGRPRPAAVELPVDVLDAEDQVEIPPLPPVSPPVPPPDQIEAAAAALNRADRPVIWAGGGVISSGAAADLAHLAEILQAPVLTSNLGKGAVPPEHPLHLGHIAGQPRVRDYLRECDLLLAVGTRFAYNGTYAWTLELPPRIVHLDIDPEVIGKNYPAEVAVVGDARAGLEALVGACSGGAARRPGRAGEVAELRARVRARWEEEYPTEWRLVQDIRAALPRETIICFDLTMCAYAAWQMLDVYEPRTYLYPAASATLGYGLPAALGAKVARPERPVVALCGDGGFQFTCQELATAAQFDIHTVTVVFNDSRFRVLEIQQEERFDRPSATGLANPDFVGLARAFGIDAVRLDGFAGLRDELSAAIARDRSMLIEVAIPPSTFPRMMG